MKEDADTPNPPLFFTPVELAERWKISTMTLRRWRNEGKFKVVHFGRSVRIELSEVQRVEREARA